MVCLYRLVGRSHPADTLLQPPQTSSFTTAQVSSVSRKTCQPLGRRPAAPARRGARRSTNSGSPPSPRAPGQGPPLGSRTARAARTLALHLGVTPQQSLPFRHLCGHPASALEQGWTIGQCPLTAVGRMGQLHMNWSRKWTFNTIQSSRPIFFPTGPKFQTLQIVEDLSPGLYNPKSLKFCAQN